MMWEPCNYEPCRIKNKKDACLHKVFKEFISIDDYELARAQEVFHAVFDQLSSKMKTTCNYYRQYCKEVLYGGSVYDGTKVGHMNEFDMDIVVKLPVNYNEIILENDEPGFLRLKITAFDNLDKQPNWEDCHKVTKDWRDADKYLLPNKIRSWLQGVVARAVNELNGQVTVNGTVYSVSHKESGPACTLQVRGAGHGGPRLDVDLVPVVRFMLPRAPPRYDLPIEVEGKETRDWFVVPKPVKVVESESHRNRGWRLSFHNHEKAMMKGSCHLKSTIRLVKKLRDGLELNNLASYYIKTLFLWEIQQKNDKSYWSQRPSVTFRAMVEKLHIAVQNKKINYFWHPGNNLLQGVSFTTLKKYEIELKKVLVALDGDDCDKIVEYILTKEELTKYKNSEINKELTGTTIEKTSLSNLSSVVISLQPPQPFHFEISSDASPAWKQCKRSFRIFYEACELSKKNQTVQKNMLLHIIGDQCRKMYDRTGEDVETIDEMFQTFDEVFSPKNNQTVERHAFFTRDQKDSESIEQYIIALNKLAVKCGFKDLSDELVRDRLVSGVKDKELRGKLFREVDLSSSKAIVMCKLAETAREQVRPNNKENVAREVKLETKQSTDADVDKVDCGDYLNCKATSSRVRVYSTYIACSYCGKRHRRRQCPAYGQKCMKCSGMNHFTEVCWWKTAEEIRSDAS